MTILLTGATGLIGKQVGQALVRAGHNVVAVSRDIEKAKFEAPFPAEWIQCDLQKDTFRYPKPLDGVIHLAGENIGEGRWSQAQKEKILQSRVAGTKNLLASVDISHLRFFSAASAMGIYGESEIPATEDTPAGQGFLSDVVRAWEHEVLEIGTRTRICLFRIGVVLSTQGGALPQMVFPARIFASSALGSGRQWMSWIHIDDVVRAFVQSVDDEKFHGIFNLVAPEPVRQKTMAREIARVIGAMNGPPVPKLVLRLMLGEQAALALVSLRVSSKKLESIFRFKFETLEGALKDILGSWNDGASVKTYQQYFPQPVDRVFAFFAEAENLEKITPAFLNFRIHGKSTEKIAEGTLIDYSLKVRGFPLKWKTLIDKWQPNTRFRDVQLKGPYSIWEHEHTFEPLGPGTLMTDTIRYKLPAGLPGRLAAQAYVDKDVDSIFRYRREVVAEYL